MRNYNVTCQSASGHVVTVSVTARSDQQACSRALATLDPAAGWRALRAL